MTFSGDSDGSLRAIVLQTRVLCLHLAQLQETLRLAEEEGSLAADHVTWHESQARRLATELGTITAAAQDHLDRLDRLDRLDPP